MAPVRAGTSHTRLNRRPVFAGSRTHTLPAALATSTAATRSADYELLVFDGRIPDEHVEAYCAIPAMGAVLHTLNIRLAAEQISFIANHAEDEVVIVDGSLTEQLAAVLPELPMVHTVIVTGNGNLAGLAESGKSVVRYDDFIAGQPTDFDWPERSLGRRAALRC